MRKFPILMAILIVVAGCSSGRWVRSELEVADDHDHIEIYLEQRIEEDAIVPQGFEHPFTMAADDLGFVLCGLLRWNSRLLSGDEVVRVFEPSEVAALAPALKRALAAASADERVRFVSHDWEGGLLSSNKRATQGVVFVERGGCLNFAFLEIDEEIRPNDYAQLGRERAIREPTEITSSSRPLAERSWLTIVPRADGEGVHPLWCAIDLQKARVAMSSAREAAPPAEITEKDTPAISPPRESERTAAIKEKLKLLKEMLDEGLITEKDYEQKKAELLKTL